MNAANAAETGRPTSQAPPLRGVSVILPVYNAAPYITQALASVRSQTLPVAEIIVVDDGSTDAGPEIVAADSRVTLLRRPHAGIAATVNAGVAAARGELIAFLDADDRWLPEKTALQHAALERDPGLMMIFGHGRRFLDTGSAERVIDVRPAVSRCSGLFRRQAFATLGPFDSGDMHDFMGWMLAAQDAGLRLAMLPETVFERRIHQANYSRTSRGDQRQAYFNTLRAASARRRLRGNTSDS
jgi:glycosyltransferase involved in cell wall biosynthesis